MRLLQISTGMGELVDLHPRVTVVTHLDDSGRRLLTDTVIGLARAKASGPGLLEAYGVLFDLSAELLALLDITAGDVRPVVTPDDLPSRRVDPRAAERRSAQQTLAEIEARWKAAEGADGLARAAVAAAAEAVAEARAALEAADASAGETSGEDPEGAGERRRRLAAELEGVAADREAAVAARAEAESVVIDARARREDAIARRASVVARLDQARSAIDPEAESARDAARAELAEVEAAVEAEREAARPADQAEDDEPPAARVARLDVEIEALERRRAAFGPADPGSVAGLVEQLREAGAGAVVPMPEAVAIIEELEGLDAELVTMEAAGGAPGGGLPEARARLDAAQGALVEAEQAARNPALARDTVERLEQAHADLLDAVDKADSRFAGARAARRVEALRAEERAILDELGFTSYSDFMMVASRRRAEPERRVAVQAARAELAAAESAWHAMEAETDAELTRAQMMERRRVLIDEARALVGRPVPPGSLVDELRALRIAAEPSPALITDLREALEGAGVAVGDESLDRDELLLVADAWISEAGGSGEREQELLAELARLGDERAAAIDALEPEPGALDDPDEAERAERLAGARRRAVVAEDRLRAHLVAEENAAFLAEELKVAGALEEAAAAAAAESDAAHATAIRRDQEVRAAYERVEAELAAAAAEPDGDDPRPRDELAARLAEAEAAQESAVARAADSAGALSSLTAQRRQAATDHAALHDGDVVVESGSLAEEVEWYLLARLAAQRSVSLAGSVPLVLDDALGAFDDEELEHVLGRLERMAEAVQLIVISDDPRAASWAAQAGGDRAAVVRPEPGSTR